MKPIPYGRQNITREDIDAVVEVLKSDFLTQGPKVKEFEEKFADYVGAKYAVAVSNGTAALHLCNLALGTKPGDKVITTPITFVASANSVLYCGGEVDFVDIKSDTYTIDLDKLEEKLQSVPKGTYKGIIPVDLAGYPVDVERLREIANEYELWILEDACHAPGGYFTDSKGIDQYCGNGVYSDLQIFSFHPVKHIATGEGGMVTTNNEQLYEKLLLLRTHGITKNTKSFQNSIDLAYGNFKLTNENSPVTTNDPMTTNDLITTNAPMTTSNSLPHKYPGWYYEMQELGYNYRLSDINSALGVSQLKRAKEGVEKRNKIAERYNDAFSNVKSIKTPFVADNVYHAYHLYIIQVEDRKGLYDYLKENKIYTQVHYIPVHLQPYYKNLGWRKGDFPVAEAYYEKALSLPMFPSLTEKEQEFVIDKVIEFISK